MATEILFPPGRIIGGSLYSGQTKNDKNEPLTFADGSPRTSFGFGVAIPKKGEQHWNQTPWGQALWAAGVAEWPAIHQAPQFAWKVKDGDSTIPNKKGKRPCDQAGHAGCWIVWFGGNFAPRVTKDAGRTEFPEKDAVKGGHWVEVFANVTGNKRSDSPGMYVNYGVVNFVGYDTEIVFQESVDAAAVGFGQQAPAHVSTAPVASMQQPAPTAAAPTAPAAPVTPHAGYMAPTAPVAPAAPIAPPPVTKPFPPAGWAQHPQNPAYYYCGAEVVDEPTLRARNL